jgi:hypothetical protein
MPNTVSERAIATDFDGAQELMSADQLAEYLRSKLDLALSLASNSEQERRSRHWESAEHYHRQWQDVMAEVQRLLPAVKASGVSLFESERVAPRKSRARDRTEQTRIVPMVREKKLNCL